MSLLDTVEPDGWVSTIKCIGPEYGKELYGKLPIQSLQSGYYLHTKLYSRETVESLIPQCRKEALLEAVEVCKTIANDAEDCGATPEMLEIVYAIEDELRRRAEGEK